MSTHEIYVAHRILDQPIPLVPAHTATCSTCGALVWVSNRRAPGVVESMLLLCVPCAKDFAVRAATRGEDIEITGAEVLDAKPH